MNRILIDTHILIWALKEPEKLKERDRLILENLDVDCYVSIICLYEIAIKKSLNKIGFDFNFKAAIEKTKFKLLNINYDHLEIYSSLFLHHKDPFDRMIISQSIAENIPLISYDKVFEKYDYPKP